MRPPNLPTPNSLLGTLILIAAIAVIVWRAALIMSGKGN